MNKKEKQRDAYLRRYYNLSLAKYNEILKVQNFACACCGRPASKFRTALAVEHSHDSGIVRGLVCSWCNRGLRYFRDDPSTLRAAADHLERNYGTVPDKYLKGRKKRRKKRSTRRKRR